MPMIRPNRHPNDNHDIIMDNNNWRPSPSQGPVVGGGGGGVGAPGGGGGEAAMDFLDWRSQVQPDSRRRIVNKI
uniref:Uncharacterized protein n=1 Tax=Quercus lobata TaxID=97700 RepID=A0A7N2LQ99_QUELO